MIAHFYPYGMEDVCIQEQSKVRKDVTVAPMLFLTFQ
jgi:hypothetical protein